VKIGGWRPEKVLFQVMMPEAAELPSIFWLKKLRLGFLGALDRGEV
jgi:hypothetical protein